MGDDTHADGDRPAGLATGPPDRTIRWLVIMALAGGIVLAAFRVTFDQFNTDELQHTHIAWLITAGELPYRDFWEHHGPLFAFSAATWIQLWDLNPGIELMVALRAMNGILAVGLLLLTYRLALAVGENRAVATAAAALLGCAYFFQDAVTEIRPDPLQNIFWLAGLAIVAGSLHRRRSTLVIAAAGVLFGAAVLTNTKAIVGPVFIAAFYLLAMARRWFTPGVGLSELALLAAGGLVPLALAGLAFSAVGALDQFVSMTTLWNLAALGVERNLQLAAANGYFMLTRQAPLLLALTFGIWNVLRDWNRQGDGRANLGRMLLLVTGVGTSALWVVNDFYPQYLLLCLPPLAVLAGRGLLALADATGRRFHGSRPRTAAVLVALTFFYLLGMAAARTPFAPHPTLLRQRAVTAEVLRTTAREEPVGALFGACAGYAFNRNLQYWWAADADVGATIQRYAGTDPFGITLVEALQNSGARYVTGRPEVLARLPDVTRQYVTANFVYDDCLWTRRR